MAEQQRQTELYTQIHFGFVSLIARLTWEQRSQKVFGSWRLKLDRDWTETGQRLDRTNVPVKLASEPVKEFLAANLCSVSFLDGSSRFQSGNFSNPADGRSRKQKQNTPPKRFQLPISR